MSKQNVNQIEFSDVESPADIPETWDDRAIEQWQKRQIEIAKDDRVFRKIVNMVETIGTVAPQEYPWERGDRHWWAKTREALAAMDVDYPNAISVNVHHDRSGTVDPRTEKPRWKKILIVRVMPDDEWVDVVIASLNYLGDEFRDVDVKKFIRGKYVDVLMGSPMRKTIAINANQAKKKKRAQIVEARESVLYGKEI